MREEEKQNRKNKYQILISFLIGNIVGIFIMIIIYILKFGWI